MCARARARVSEKTNRSTKKQMGIAVAAKGIEHANFKFIFCIQ